MVQHTVEVSMNADATENTMEESGSKTTRV